MRTATLIDWMAEGDLVFHLRRASSRSGFESDPLLDPRYDSWVAHAMTEEERNRQVERLRRRAQAS